MTIENLHRVRRSGDTSPAKPRAGRGWPDSGGGRVKQKYKYLFPFTVLDRGFDRTQDRKEFIRSVGREIHSKGSYVAGIDVEPNFDNGSVMRLITSSCYGPPAKRYDDEAPIERIYIPPVKAPVETTSETQWAEAEAAEKWKDATVRKSVAKMVSRGNKIGDACEKAGIPVLAVNWVGRELSRFCYLNLIPSDADNALRAEFWRMPLSEKLVLALSLSDI